MTTEDFLQLCDNIFSGKKTQLSSDKDLTADEVNNINDELMDVWGL